MCLRVQVRRLRYLICIAAACARAAVPTPQPRETLYWTAALHPLQEARVPGRTEISSRAFHECDDAESQPQLQGSVCRSLALSNALRNLSAGLEE